MIQQSQTDAPAVDSYLIDLQADMTEDAEFGVRRLVVSKAEVVVLDEAGAVVLRVPFSEIETARNEPVVSGGRLLLRTKAGEDIVATSYSLTHADLFSEAARGIEQLAKGQELSINLKLERTRCESCGRLLPEKDGVCPACLKRGKTFMRVAAYLKPYRRHLGVLVTISLLATGLNLIPPQFQRLIVDRLTAGELELGGLMQLVGAWFAIAATAVTLQVFSNRMMTFLGSNIAADLRASTFNTVQRLHVAYFDKKTVGAITSRITHDTDRIWMFLVDGMPFMVTNGLVLIGVIFFLFRVDWVLALAIMAPLPLMAVLAVTFWKPLSSMFHKVSQKWARIYMHINEAVSGVRVVKAFVREDHEFARFQTRNNECLKAAMAADQRWYTILGAMSLCVSLGVLINWGLGGYFVLIGRLTLGEFIMTNAYLIMVYGPLMWFAQINNWFSRAMASAERIFEMMDMPPDAGDGDGIEHEIVGEIQFDNVRFGYDKSNPVLKGVSFTAKAGEMIGLVGHSGAGKSTTINLIARFYEPDAGTLKIDGIDYKDLNLHSYRSQIGIVMQDPFLFHGTIAENISYGKPDASIEEIMAAARAANAHNFVLAKPNGYDTIVGERGAKLSGGERQRISIARAILHDPRILILDEATSSVDVETEKEIQEAISHLIKGRTTFAIAHRLSTLRNADRLIVLERGEVSEIGTHAELMEKKGTFYKLVQIQSAINEIVGVGVIE
ncbi:MAG: ABC transporter ATP-binding protein [Armatimonadetes bacterium]|nr:ABC transporter ATP-binding protein [Armatimonadota bacterium]